jgi:DNA-binding NarL/FixJ family response regulator
MYDEDSLVMDMLDAGARGYLLKNAHREELVQAIKTVQAGGNYFSNATSKKLVSLIASGKHNPYQKNGTMPFTEQEMRIIKMICRQFTTKQIASELGLSPRTVEDYRHRIQEKTGARCAVGIALYAVKNNIVALNEL